MADSAQIPHEVSAENDLPQQVTLSLNQGTARWLLEYVGGRPRGERESGEVYELLGKALRRGSAASAGSQEPAPADLSKGAVNKSTSTSPDDRLLVIPDSVYERGHEAYHEHKDSGRPAIVGQLTAYITGAVIRAWEEHRAKTAPAEHEALVAAARELVEAVDALPVPLGERISTGCWRRADDAAQGVRDLLSSGDGTEDARAALASRVTERGDGSDG